MTEEKLLNIRDVSEILGLSEKEVIDLAEKGSIPAYKIGGIYLRFKRQQVEEIKRKLKLLSRKEISNQKYTFTDRLSDFFYFNDFYILSFLVIVLILFIIFQGY
ncbi:MAG: helix-turn-helix domain-containing protein [Candidatus Omnitrophica bacterium]|jgi:excisionase family DNA binding protein|nr:helix-turn-helix domain-containing protein [Candidatus Omnitrophota bacterium]MDD5512748.1 helix-turn-helix domain-containing protein [Candidatus Omnitrophota bacterium]